jgi:hypothetical protein
MPVTNPDLSKKKKNPPQDSFLFTGAKQYRWCTLFAGAKHFQTANSINQEAGHINNGRSKYVIRTISDKIMYKSQQEF